MKFKKLLSAALVAGSVLAAGGANAFPTFTINPAVFGGPATPLVGDKFNGDYRELFTFGATVGGVTPFSVSIRFIAATLANTNNGQAFAGFQSGLENNYRIYGLFRGTGTATATLVGTNTVTKFAANTGTLNVFVDPGPGGLSNPSNPDTLTFNDPATGASFFTPNDTGLNDQLIATGSLISGSGTTTIPTSSGGQCPNNDCGSFGQTTSFQLNSIGSSYFTSPNPFYDLSFQTGQFNGVPIPSGGGNAITNGSLDVEFNKVPEPSTIALLGLTLLGLGVVRRRKS